MKKIILILIAVATLGTAKAQTGAVALGTGSAIAAGGCVATFLILSKRDLAGYSEQTSYTKRDAYKQNGPWLFVGAGMAIMSIASFADGAVIYKRKDKTVSMVVDGYGVGIAYSLR